MSSLHGKVAVVTGIAHGIGAAIGAMLTEEGAEVHGIDRDTVDVTEAAQVNSFVHKLGQVDILVNAAGGVVGQVHHPIEETTEESWHAVLDANLTGTFLFTRAVVPGMKAAGWGRIVNISSGAGRSVSLTGIAGYTSAKAGQIGFTRQMAVELGPFGITANCIAPGLILSNPATQRQWEGYSETVQRAYIKSLALRRLGKAEDIANGVRYFTSEGASWVTGQVISIDGGHALF